MYVYAVELNKKVLLEKEFINNNPNYKEDKPCILLSISSVHPEKRFEEIKSGVKHVKFAKKYGICLLLDLTKKANDSEMDAYQAAKCIYNLAKNLRNRGYGVFIPKGFLSRCKVYVVKLKHSVITNIHFRDANPGYKNRKPCVYVGMTTKEPEERFQDHKNGRYSNRFVYEYGECLLKELYEKHNEKFMYSWEASSLEKHLAQDLRQQGYGVWQN